MKNNQKIKRIKKEKKQKKNKKKKKKKKKPNKKKIVMANKVVKDWVEARGDNLTRQRREKTRLYMGVVQKWLAM